ncbi:MAG: prolyl oligopeptidase family serine peptidase [Candidatus Helarchaeota archaeon]
MKIKKLVKYLIIIFGYFILFSGLFSGIIILTGGNLIFSLYDLFFASIALYNVGILSIITLIMIRVHSKNHKYWLIPLSFGLFVIILNSLPLFSTPFIIYNGDSQFKHEFGNNYLNHISINRKSQFKPYPVSLWELFNGVESSKCNISYNDKIYATRGNDSYTFDVYSPLSGSGPFPAIILLHGGGWVRGDKGQLGIVNKYLASHGYVIFDIRYGLAKASMMGIQTPEFIDISEFESKIYNDSINVPQMVENIGKFTDFLVAHKDSYHINISSVYIMGRSAGAHLAGLFLGYNNTFKHIFNTAMKIRGIILFYPPANITLMYNHFINDVINTVFPDSVSSYFSYLFNGTPTTNKTSYDIYSPVYHVNNRSPPILIFHGMQDELVPFEISVQLQNRMHVFNRPCILVSFPFYGHATDLLYNGIGGQIAIYYLERFLTYTLENSV